MGVESVKKHVSIAIKSCNGLVLRHPLLVFMVFVLIWIYQFFPSLFSLLVRASPVIASSLVLLGTLLFYGHANVAKVDKEVKTHNHNLKFVDKSYFVNKKLNQEKKSEVVARSEMKISSNASRRNSIDENIDLDDKGWETGSDLLGSSSPRSSMGDMFPMLDEIDPLLESEARQQMIDYSSERSIESAEVINETDDYDDDDDEHDLEVKDDDDDDDEEEDDIVITWTEDDQRNVMNLGTSELERNQRLENLIARQQALKNMRIIAENNMVNISPNLALNATHISTARINPFDPPYDLNQNILRSAPSVIIPGRNPFDLPYDPSGQKLPDQVGPMFQANDPFIRRYESFDVGPSTLGSYFAPECVASDGINYSSLHSQVGEDGPSREADLNAGYQDKSSDKSSSSSFFDVADDIYDGDDEEEEEFRSIDMSLTQDLKDLQVEDNSSNDGSGSNSEPRIGNKLSTMQDGLKSWFTGWKA